MNYVYLIVGLALVIAVFVDLIYTALSTNGAGWLSRGLSRLIWKAFFFVLRGKARNRLLNHVGMSIIFSILCGWIVLLWAGNVLILCSDPASIRNTQTQAIATLTEKIYYVGYTISTLGNGDFYAPSSTWKIVSVSMALVGLSLVTIAITYLGQVLTSEIGKRQISLYIAALGGTPQDILLNCWDGSSFRRLERVSDSLVTQIFSHSQHHLAYPVIHYFHSSRLRESASVNLAALDEALTILLVCIPKENRPDSFDLGSLRLALTTYLHTLHGNFLQPSDQELPLPDLTRLKEKGIPLIEDEDRIGQGYERLLKRRRMLKAVIEYGGWTWQDMNRSKFVMDIEVFDD